MITQNDRLPKLSQNEIKILNYIRISEINFGSDKSALDHMIHADNRNNSRRIHLINILIPLWSCNCRELYRYSVVRGFRSAVRGNLKFELNNNK